MKPEYIKIMQRKIHAANVLMGRQKSRPDCNFNSFCLVACPTFWLSERTDNTLYDRYKIACAITGIDRRERTAGNEEYVGYLHNWSMFWPTGVLPSIGVLPLTPEEWRIKTKRELL